MINFPYGISDFQYLINQGQYYIDRTHFIPNIESAGNQLLFLRPRRFGKSLWLSVLENYYDVARAKEFERLFGHLAIGKNPTPNHNRYLILKWDFSGIRTDGTAAEIGKRLYSHINVAIEQFIEHYRDIVTYPIYIDRENAQSSFESLLIGVQASPYKLYLLIDEYDNFANEVLMSSRLEGQRRYEELVKGEGIFRTLFKVVKSASSGRGLERVFITGVSPVVMSDLSSAYNVATDISLEADLNMLCGFSEAELSAALQEVANHCQLSEAKAQDALELMRLFYDGYRFSTRNPERVYNPILVLHFLRALQKYCTYPDEMLDSNLAMDRNRIAYIAQLEGAEKLIATLLNESEPLLVANLSQRFGVADILSQEKKSQDYLASLLYYLGVLTLAGRTDLKEYILKIPNLVVRELYVDRLRQLLLPNVDDQAAGQQVAKNFFTTGALPPVCQFVEQRLFSTFDNRDYLAANELTVKTAFLTLLFNDQLFIIDSETAIERTYADGSATLTTSLTMMRRPDLLQHPLLHDLLFEFKYVALGDVKSLENKIPAEKLTDEKPTTGKGRADKQRAKKLSGRAAHQLSDEALRALPEVQAKLSEARTQLRDYRTALQAHYGERLRLRTYAVVALGFERLVWEAV